MKYRSRTEITASILDVAIGGVTKTKIMYGALVSHTQAKEYLDILFQNGLLEYSKNDRKIKTTEKGMRFLRIYTQLDELAPKVTE
jgi:predicted transcriptional regulator